MKNGKRLASLSLAVTMAFSSTASVLAEVSAQSIQARAEIPAWSRDNASSGMYAPNTKVTHNGKVWLQISNEICWWDEPGSNDAVWQEYSVIEGDTSFIKPWDQDFAVNNGYVVGSQVTHNGKTWEQVWDRTCWWEEPGTDSRIWKEVNTNIAPEVTNSDIYLTQSDTLLYNEDDGYYSITEGFTSLSGGVNSKYNVSSIKAEVFVGKLCIYSNIITGSNGFELADVNLLQGANILKITAETIEQETLEEEFVIVNVTEDHVGKYEPDMGDNDGDGLENFYEETLGTDKDNADTDGDGLTDREELEITKTDPTNPDTSGNGTLDGDEDYDEDGLTTKEELLYGTSPTSPDSDFDGINDGEELRIGTDPLNHDSDNDGVEDGLELIYGLDPLKEDSFDDGIIDCDRIFDHSIDNKSETEDDLIKVDVAVSGTISEIGSANVSNVAEDDFFINDKIPGFLANGFEITMDENSEVFATFQIDESLMTDSNVKPEVYFWNEEIQFLEKLEPVADTRGTSNSITIKVQKNGKLIVLDANVHDEIWTIDLLSPNSTTTSDIDIVFTIDSSGSMSRTDSKGIRKSATIDFINLLEETDQGAVVDFDGSAKLYQSLTPDKNALIAAVNRIDSSGYTNIYEGLRLALEQFSYRTPLTSYDSDYNNDLVVLTDSDYLLSESADADSGDAYNLDSTEETRDANRYVFLMTDGEGTASNYGPLIDQAKAKEVVVYCVGLGSGVNTTLMTAIAKETGGKYVHANNAVELEAVFAGISEDLTDFNNDTDGDMLNDYYEKKIASGELRLGTGAKLGDLDWNNADCDGDGLLDGEEIIVMSTERLDSDSNKIKTQVYVKKHSDPLKVDSDDDGYSDLEDNLPLTEYKIPVILLHGRIDNSLRCFGVRTNVHTGRELDSNTNNNFDTDYTDNQLLYTDVETHQIQYINPRTGTQRKPTDLGYSLVADARYKINQNLFAFNYPNQDMTKQNALKLEMYLDNLSEEMAQSEYAGIFYPTKEALESKTMLINLIGHSNGGLVSRYYIENLNHSSEVNQLITIDTPHWGSGWADASLTNIFALPMDVDLSPGGLIFGGEEKNFFSFNFLPSVQNKLSYINENQTDELKYWNKGSTEYVFLAGYDLLYDIFNPDSMEFVAIGNIDFDLQLDNIATFGDFEMSVRDGVLRESDHPYLVNNSEFAKEVLDMKLSSGDNVVNNQSQLGLKFKKDKDTSPLIKKVAADHAWMNMDTHLIHNPAFNFHIENQHRHETNDAVLSFLEKGNR